MTRRVGSFFTVIFAVFMISGCATYSPIPDGYTGPRARILDSVNIHSSTKADFFSVEAVDGQTIANSRIKTRQVNQGRGMFMGPVVIGRDIPARPTVLKLVGRTEYGAPILALTKAVYQVQGDIQFEPQANKSYVVKGELSENYSAIWIEDVETNTVVGKKIEIMGSTKLNLFEK